MLRKTSFPNVLAVCVLLATGCSPSAAPLPQDEEPLSNAVSDNSAGSTTGRNVDLSVPRLEPNPLVWLEEWPGPEAVSKARQRAQQLMSLADYLKSTEDFQKAEDYYQKAMQADPTWGYPPYQLACNCELSNQHNRAMQQFTKAVELGFDDFPTALSDDELGRIREDSGFTAALLKIRDRYIASSKKRIGQPLAVRPSDTRPIDGWPVMLLLHGYGDSNLSYRENAEKWAELGFLTIAVPGSVPASEGRYMWSMESTEPTHQDLQTIVESPLIDGIVNRDKVFLLGFSQGALHAMLLTAENPDVYAGVVGLSPGGSLAKQLATPPVNASGRPACCMFIHGVQEPHAPFVRIWSQACDAAGWRFDSRIHPGAHHFPEDWDAMRPEIAAFLSK